MGSKSEGVHTKGRQRDAVKRRMEKRSDGKQDWIFRWVLIQEKGRRQGAGQKVRPIRPGVSKDGADQSLRYWTAKCGVVADEVITKLCYVGKNFEAKLALRV